MTAPLYDAHGHTIPDLADHNMTDEELDDLVRDIGAIPTDERPAWFAALVQHWDHIHYGDPGTHDLVRLVLRPGGALHVATYWTYYDTIAPRDDLTILPVSDIPGDIW